MDKYNKCFEGSSVKSDSMYIKLISSDEHEFILKRKVASVSSVITNLLSGPFPNDEIEMEYIKFSEIPSHALQSVCRYLCYKSYYPTCSTSTPIFDIPPGSSLEFLILGQYFGC